MTEPETKTEAERVREAEEWRERVRGRNVVLGLILAGLVVLFFALSVVRFPTF